MPCQCNPVNSQLSSAHLFFFRSLQLWYKVSASLIYHFSLAQQGFVISHLLCFCRETWSPAHSSALQARKEVVQQAGRQTSKYIMRWQEQFTCTLTVTAPLQVCDLQLQASQHGQVLLLQEGDASLHTGHLLLEPPGIHGRTPAEPVHRCWWLVCLWIGCKIYYHSCLY